MDDRIKYAIAIFGREMFFEDWEEENDKVSLEKVDNYAEYTVPSMKKRQFQKHFWINPECTGSSSDESDFSDSDWFNFLSFNIV